MPNRFTFPNGPLAILVHVIVIVYSIFILIVLFSVITIKERELTEEEGRKNRRREKSENLFKKNTKWSRRA